MTQIILELINYRHNVCLVGSKQNGVHNYKQGIITSVLLNSSLEFNCNDLYQIYLDCKPSLLILTSLSQRRLTFKSKIPVY